jgi:branched-chain amino acid transport system substrate-binding protein
MKMKSFASALAAVAAAGFAPGAMAADDAYKIGLSGALTGPVAGTYAPAIEGLRLYIDKINKAGGINGKPVKLLIQDDQGQASKAATNAKQMLTQDDVDLLINSSLSSTYAPMISMARREDTPMLFAASVCPDEVFPPAQKLLFCTTSFASEYDSRAALAFVDQQAKGQVKLGLASMAIPVSRGEIDYAEGLAKEKGMQPVAKETIPPVTPNYTPFATNIQNAGADWVYSWAPWVTQVKTLEALRRLGWNGDYITWAHLEAEDEFKRLNDDKLYAVGANALFSENLPVQKEMAAAAKAANSTYPAKQMTDGWITGMVIEEAFKKAGWPVTSEKLLSSMQNLSVDTKGLRGGPIEWTEDNHFRTRQYYRVYRWNPKTETIDVAQDWVPHDIK